MLVFLLQMCDLAANEAVFQLLLLLSNICFKENIREKRENQHFLFLSYRKYWKGILEG